MSAVVLAALPAIDNFNRADGGLGANWTTVSGQSAGSIATNAVQVTTVGADAVQYWNADAFAADQYGKLKVLACATDTQRAVLIVLRANGSAGAATFLAAGVRGPLGATATVTIRTDSSIVSSGTFTVNANDILRATIVGTTMTLYVNDVQAIQASVGGTIVDGSAGYHVFVDSGTAADARFDDFEAGNGTGASAAASPRRLLLLDVGGTN